MAEEAVGRQESWEEAALKVSESHERHHPALPALPLPQPAVPSCSCLPGLLSPWGTCTSSSLLSGMYFLTYLHSSTLDSLQMFTQKKLSLEDLPWLSFLNFRLLHLPA